MSEINVTSEAKEQKDGGALEQMAALCQRLTEIKVKETKVQKCLSIGLKHCSFKNYDKSLKFLKKVQESGEKNDDLEELLQLVRHQVEAERRRRKEMIEYNENVQKQSIQDRLVAQINHKVEKRDRNFNCEYAKYGSLKDFGYEFNDEGFLVKIDYKDESEKYFEFQGNDHYDWLSDFVIEHIHDKLVQDFGLVRKVIDHEGTDKEIFIFHSEKALTTSETVLLIMPGSGRVQAGIWSVAICINSPHNYVNFWKDGKEDGGLRAGTCFEYIERAKQLGWEVILTNPNKNYTLKGEQIERHSTPTEHTQYVYDNVLSDCKANNLLLLAHSYGGVCVVDLLKERTEILRNLRGIAMTDSVHDQLQVDNLGIAKSFLHESAKNWIRSTEPLNHPLGGRAGCTLASAGCTIHEWTSHHACDSVFEHLSGELTSNLPPEEKLKITEKYRDQGNDFFKKKLWENAIQTYNTCLVILKNTKKFNPKQMNEALNLKMIVLNNLGAVHLQLKNFAEAISVCSESINIDVSTNPELKSHKLKSYFRRSKAHQENNDYAQAKKDLMDALNIDPENIAVKKSIRNLQQIILKKKELDKKKYSKMFG